MDMSVSGDKSKVKNIVKENKEIFQEDTSQRLFGEKIDDKIMEVVKLKISSSLLFEAC